MGLFFSSSGFCLFPRCHLWSFPLPHSYPPVHTLSYKAYQRSQSRDPITAGRFQAQLSPVHNYGMALESNSSWLEKVRLSSPCPSIHIGWHKHEQCPTPISWDSSGARPHTKAWVSLTIWYCPNPMEAIPYLWGREGKCMQPLLLLLRHPR